MNGLVVKSLGPQVVVGRARQSSRTRASRTPIARSTSSPGIEYDFFPYSESSRRSLTLPTRSARRLRLQRGDDLRQGRGDRAQARAGRLARPAPALGLARRSSRASAQHLNDTERSTAWSVFGSADVRLVQGLLVQRLRASTTRSSDLIGLAEGRRRRRRRSCSGCASSRLATATFSASASATASDRSSTRSSIRGSRRRVAIIGF